MKKITEDPALIIALCLTIGIASCKKDSANTTGNGGSQKLKNLLIGPTGTAWELSGPINKTPF
jgi:hypothetical protein